MPRPRTHQRSQKWSLGVLNVDHTAEVPGSFLLLPELAASSAVSHGQDDVQLAHKKRTADGKIILEPQPTASPNDPLTWHVVRRDVVLGAIGLYCLIGGGMTPVLAAGFTAIANDLNVPSTRVALTCGFFMLGLGLGSVLLSPTAILYGKRPVYLAAAVGFVLTNVWCAMSPSYMSLLIARAFMGLAVSSVECLPSASISEIYFLHEKAYRLGIYTLLLLGGKNVVPLVSAVIIQSLGWRWVFWIAAMIVTFVGILLFFFVPETFWDRTISSDSRINSEATVSVSDDTTKHPFDVTLHADAGVAGLHEPKIAATKLNAAQNLANDSSQITIQSAPVVVARASEDLKQASATARSDACHLQAQSDKKATTYFELLGPTSTISTTITTPDLEANKLDASTDGARPNCYTERLIQAPPRTYLQSLKPFSGRLNNDSWLRVASRPFVLFAYPSILWSALIYAHSIGWLIIMSETVSHIYENQDTYNFTPLQVGLVYISPFIGGILGTAVAGKLSDFIVRCMARRNNGIYEPEFRLVMVIPIAVSTVTGLIGFGWSAAERDAWILPTVFFGIISFGCSLGSTTAITFAVDSYRQYAGEALVTLNFSKNILHGLIWSLFLGSWLNADGSKTVFMAIGCIQLACLLTTIPMYIYGKRARMWTARQNMMARF